MTSLVLAASNHASFNSSIWSAWAGAPHDLLLVTEVILGVVYKQSIVRSSQDGMLEAHCGMLLPLSRHLAAIVLAQPDTELTQVFFKDHLRIISTARCSRRSNDLGYIRPIPSHPAGRPEIALSVLNCSM